MKFSLVLFAFVIVIAIVPSCTDRGNTRPELELVADDNMATTDSLFSEMSKAEGMKTAFLYFMEDDATIIRPNSNPITGADAVNFLSDLDDSNFKMTWKASRTELSASKDLGYAYGNYVISTTKIDSSLTGSYVHVWRKLEDGTWKFVLNSWNEAVEQ